MFYDNEDSKGKFWWRKLQDCDPITIEPLCELPYPPFCLETNGIKTWFDGQTLAHYIVSTGTFLNPMTRQELTREDCTRLDKYISKHRLKDARVRDAFEIRNMINKGGEKEGDNRAERLRREATVVFHSLFDFQRYEDRKSRRKNQAGSRDNRLPHMMTPLPPPPPPSARSNKYVVHKETGLTVYDDDEWTPDTGDQFKEEFPELPEFMKSDGAVLQARGRGRGRGRGRATGTTLSDAPKVEEPKEVGNSKNVYSVDDYGSDQSNSGSISEDEEEIGVKNGTDEKVVKADKDNQNCLKRNASKETFERVDNSKISESESIKKAEYERVLQRQKSEQKRKKEEERKKMLEEKKARIREEKEREKKQKNNEKSMKRNMKKKSESEKVFQREQLEETWDIFYAKEMSRRNKRKFTLRSVLLLQLIMLVLGTKTILPEWIDGFYYTLSIILWIIASIAFLLFLARRSDDSRPFRGVRHPDGGSPWAMGDRVGVTIIAIGTRGDVQPLIAVGKQLRKLSNIDVLVCAPSDFQNLVEQNGLDFASCGIERFGATVAWAEAKTSAEFMQVAASQYMSQYTKIAQSCWEACNKTTITRNGKSRTFRTDVVLCGHFGVLFGFDIAEALDTPCWALKFKPDTPTWTTPPFGMKPSYKWLENIGLYNRMLYLLEAMSTLKAAQSCEVTKYQNKFRKGLKLPPITGSRVEESTYYLPTIYGFSSHVFPRPKDWPVWHRISGYWFLDDSRDTVKQTDLNNVLGPHLSTSSTHRPICVTLGSMAEFTSSTKGNDVGEWESLLEKLVLAALEVKPRRKCILVTGKTNVGVDGEDNNEANTGAGFLSRLNAKDRQDVVVLSDIPHEVLFPQCALVVHHGGAGTTARCFHAGVPSVVVPILRWYDQGGWGLVVENFGVGNCIWDISSTPSDMSAIFHEALSNRNTKKGAHKLGKAIRAENGAEYVVKALQERIQPNDDAKSNAHVRMNERHCLIKRFGAQFK